MTKKDRYFLFVFYAISEPVESPSFKYFYDRENKKLIMKNKDLILKTEKDWIELPKLTTKEKKSFLEKFGNNLKGAIFDSFMNIVEEFNDYSNFIIDNDIKEIDKNLALEFYFSRVKFLEYHVNRLYSKYGLNEDMKIEFPTTGL